MTDYEKYINEVFQMKEKTHRDFLNSGYEHYSDFIREDLKGMSIRYHNREHPAEHRQSSL
ncbi:MAG: hypothetical protein HPY53_06330 [Brevinematales bacterium]|nr:hypothetical protein [Brevinematales bacterium]